MHVARSIVFLLSLDISQAAFGSLLHAQCQHCRLLDDCFILLSLDFEIAFCQGSVCSNGSIAVSDNVGVFDVKTGTGNAQKHT